MGHTHTREMEVGITVFSEQSFLKKANIHTFF